MSVRVLALDPGFEFVGYSLIEFTPEGDKILAMGLIRTKKSKDKKSKATEDNLRRAQEIALQLMKLSQGCKFIVAESMSHPRNASVAGKVALVWGVLACVSAMQDIVLIQTTPQSIHKHLCNNVQATKEDVQAALTAKYGDLSPFVAGIPAGQLEHPYDSLGAFDTCSKHPLLDMARVFARSKPNV